MTPLIEKGLKLRYNVLLKAIDIFMETINKKKIDEKRLNMNFA